MRRGTSVGEGRKGKGREIVFAELGGGESRGASGNAVRGEEDEDDDDDDDDGRSAKAAEARLR